MQARSTCSTRRSSGPTAAVAEKNPDLAADEQADVGAQVGIGAVKYADLSTDRIKDYVFDWDRMLAFEGNTAPYLQYAHARIRSIFRRAEVDRDAVRRDADRARRAAGAGAGPASCCSFDARRRTTRSSSYSPHRLCTYLFELAQSFTAFYEHCPVLKAEPTSHAR